MLRYYAYMAGLVQIRNVPDSTRKVLKARAASRGQSLNSYLLDLLEREAARPSMAEVLERVRHRVEMADVSSVEVISEARAERDAQLMERMRS